MRLFRTALLAAILLAVPAGCSKPPAPLAYDIEGAQSWCASGDTGCESITLAGEPAPLLPQGPPPPLTGPVTKGMRLVVSLSAQRLYVFDDGDFVTSSPVSTGKPGHGTPTGTYRVLEKQLMHHSNKYSNAPMPYMQRLTEGGVAIHAGALPGYPASHGCIRLPGGFAKRLYAMTSRRTTVTIVHARPRSAERAFALARAI